jgi:hypothetical protein
MCAEGAIAIWAAVRARSVALLGFGADSGIELASALVVFLRFRTGSRINETKAARTTGLLLFALAAFILCDSILALSNAHFQPQTSYAGIALLIAAAVVMPSLLGRECWLLKPEAPRCRPTLYRARCVDIWLGLPWPDLR